MLAHRVLTETANGKLKIQMESRTLEALRTEAFQLHRRLKLAIAGSAFLLSGSVLMIQETLAPYGMGCFGLGLLVLIQAFRTR